MLKTFALQSIKSNFPQYCYRGINIWWKKSNGKNENMKKFGCVVVAFHFFSSSLFNLSDVRFRFTKTKSFSFTRFAWNVERLSHKISTRIIYSMGLNVNFYRLKISWPRIGAASKWKCENEWKVWIDTLLIKFHTHTWIVDKQVLLKKTATTLSTISSQCPYKTLIL